MKLYTTVQAQKLQDGKIITVKKSQGSNTELNINITNEKGWLLAYIQVLERKGQLPMVYFVPIIQHAYEVRSPLERDAIVEIEKGKKQKDPTDGCDHPQIKPNGVCMNCGCKV